MVSSSVNVGWTGEVGYIFPEMSNMVRPVSCLRYFFCAHPQILDVLSVGTCGWVYKIAALYLKICKSNRLAVFFDELMSKFASWHVPAYFSYRSFSWFIKPAKLGHCLLSSIRISLNNKSKIIFDLENIR